MSSLRQRARYNGQDKAATITDVAQLVLDQQFRCALSGVVLQPDRSSVLGHKVAVVSGGSSEADNLFWITYEMNRLMGRMDVNQFIATCRRVASWAG